jgi:Cu-Zn family superoxide dismutase
MKAIAVFEGKISGRVTFEEQNNSIIIDIQLKGLNKNALHGFHVHESGDLTNKCDSMCAHFNPYHKQHGGPGMKNRHVGDLGNLRTDKNGEVHIKCMDSMIKLKGKANILGRGLIIHENADDCGLGENESSKINGNSGKRIACAIIAVAQDNFDTCK